MIILILTLALLGFIVWIVTTKIPMNDLFKQLIYVVVAIAVIIYLMGAFGIADIPVPRVR